MDPEFTSDMKDAQNKAKEMTAQSSSQNSEEEIARQIYSQSGTEESEENFVRRASALVKSRLKDVRTKADLYEYLCRPFEAGGLGLSDDVLSAAQKIIEDGYNRAHSVKQNYADVSVKDNLKIVQNRAVPDQLADLPINSSDKLINSITHHDEDAQKELDKIINTESAAEIGIEEILKSKPVQIQRKPVSPGKVRLDDIKTSAPQSVQPAQSQSQSSQKPYG